MAVIDQAITVNGTVEIFSKRLHQQHQVLGSVPRVKEDAVVHDAFVDCCGDEYLPDMIELGLSIRLRVEEPVVNYPGLLDFWIDIHASDYANILDQSISVAAVLATHHLDAVGVIFIQNGIVENKVTFWWIHDITYDVFPYQTRSYFITVKKSVDGVMTKSGNMIGKVGQCTICMSCQKKLTIIRYIDAKGVIML